jgi:hypothetical protein
MLKARSGDLFILGLSAINLARLQAGLPIAFDGEDFRTPELAGTGFFIFYAHTEADQARVFTEIGGTESAQHFVLCLTEEKVRRLQAGRPITFEFGVPALAKRRFYIFHAHTDALLEQILRDTGALFPEPNEEPDESTK